MRPVDILLEEAAHLARATVAQVNLVRQEAELIEAALLPRHEFEDQDDPHVHHIRPGQTTPLIIDRSTGLTAVYSENVIPFPASRNAARPVARRFGHDGR